MIYDALTTETTETTEETTEAFKEYMRMADDLFHNLRNNIEDSPEEAALIIKKQKELWEQMTDEECFYADETILRTIIDIDAEKSSLKNESNR